MAHKIYPTETGYVVDETVKWYISSEKHIQGITQMGKYTVLSSSDDDRALILACGAGNRKKVVFTQALPKGYKHAGGIDTINAYDALESTWRWRIVVPVLSEDEDNSAILHYFLFQKNGVHKLELRRITELNGAKAYAVGIAKNGNSVVMAVVIDEDGKKVQFLTCDGPNRDGNYQLLGDAWDAKKVSEKEREQKQWKPDPNWGHYSNGISLINHGKQIYFVGLNGPTKKIAGVDIGAGQGQDWVDIYNVDLETKDIKNRLIKKQNFHAICNAPSFRWGGNARVQNGMVEILAVERNVHKNDFQRNFYVKYDKFCLDIDPREDQLSLIRREIPRDPLKIPSDNTQPAIP